MERVHLDILGPFNRSKRNNAYILVMVDQFTKWVELAVLPAQCAELTARAFLNHFVVFFGCPLEIHLDQGANFQGELFRSFCKILEITKTRTTPYHPSGNGQCEVFNRVILQMIRSGFREWDEYIPLIAMALHSMKSRSTGYSANMLMLGRETIQPVDLMLGLSNQTPKSTSAWVTSLAENLSNANRSAREAIVLAQYRQKRDYDLNVLEYKYNVGDVVYLRDTSIKIGVSSKLRQPFIGPYLVVVARPPHPPPLYTIQNRKKSKVIHHDRLKPCEDSSVPLWLQRKRHILLNSISTEDEETLEKDFPLPFEFMKDAPFETLFDPNATLPYMLGDNDPFGDNVQSIDLGDGADNVPINISDIGGFADSESDESDPTENSSRQKQTRTGRNIRIPAWYLD